MGQSNGKLDASVIEKQRQNLLETELAAADLASVRNHALEISRRREQFHWQFVGASTLTVALGAAAVLTKRTDLIMPIAPLILGGFYCHFSAYGEPLEALKSDAERLLKESPKLVARPGGPITLAEIDRLRVEMYGSA
ncbi:hypothetical protein PENTCL1PPCAC_5427 [Pristionchus entomophagus]|uniref:Uncharacterized protein n=1 Tax=Pristionchus entomophagus TaxID=358040 RepID=A0AAV5SKX3_9BILA|nr:hypothetical protein PENTCL1PPCAC_5427 [Pristionchus entomophagus]